MIEETDIKKFPSELQNKIRDTIREQIERGYKLRHLALAKNGMVYLDYEQIETDADNDLWGPLSVKTDK